MHDHPGPIYVDLTQSLDLITQQLTDAFSSATFAFAAPLGPQGKWTAVFAQGYSQEKS